MTSVLKDIASRDDLASVLGYTSWAEARAIIGAAEYTAISVYQKGRWRAAHKPSPALRRMQAFVRMMVDEVYVPSAAVHGYVKGRSAKTNAAQHVNRHWVLNVDLSHFFGSITAEMVIRTLTDEPYRTCTEVARCIAKISCYNGALPMGAPCSPILSNVIFDGLDRKLARMAESVNCVYTRYSDDITISTDAAMFPVAIGMRTPEGPKVGSSLSELLNSGGFQINERKTKLARNREGQRVTGLSVSGGVEVPRLYVRSVKSALHRWEKDGIRAAAQQFAPSFKRRDFARTLKGRIDYIGSISGLRSVRYVGLRDHYWRLLSRDGLEAGTVAENVFS